MEKIEPFIDRRERSLRCPFCCKPGSTTSHFISKISSTSSQGITKVSLTDWLRKNNFVNVSFYKQKKIYFVNCRQILLLMEIINKNS